MKITDVAKQIKDEDAELILSHPEDFPKDWVDNAKLRLGRGDPK